MSGFSSAPRYGLGVCFIALCVGCSDDPSSPPSPDLRGSDLRVTVSTSGDDIDTNGYLLSIGESHPPVQVASNGSVTFTSIGPGTYQLTLTEIAPNCVLDNGPPQVTITRGVAKSADLHVTCSTLGTVQVTVATTGEDRDRNGYAIVVYNAATSYYSRSEISTSDATAQLRLTPGHYTVELHGVAANCDGTSLGPRELDVGSGTAHTLNFAVACEPVRRLAFVADVNTPQAEIYTVRSDGTGMVRLTNNRTEDTNPAWSPDGTRIAFTSKRDGPYAIYIMNENGSGVKRLTPLTGESFRPAWSPDGSRVAFASVRDGNMDVYVMNTDGTGERRLTTHPALDSDPAWSPDGTRIAFASERDGNAQIYIMNADGSGAARFANTMTEDRSPAWAPDGTRLAFRGAFCGGPSNQRTCIPRIFVAALGGPPVNVGGGDDPAWSPDGRKLAVTAIVCDYYYYYGCTLMGLGILVPFTNGAAGSHQAWDLELAWGPHSQPKWRP